MTISHRILLRMNNILDAVVQKVKTHILCLITFFQKSCRLWDNMYKCGTARQVAGNNIKKITRAHCMLDSKDYKHTLRVCNTHCISTVTLVTRTCFNCTLYVHCLPCYFSKRLTSFTFFWGLFYIFLCCSMYCLFCVVLCIVCFVSSCVFLVCICVLYDCHLVATQLQLNISYYIMSFYISYHIFSWSSWAWKTWTFSHFQKHQFILHIWHWNAKQLTQRLYNWLLPGHVFVKK
jgi:hypothetical protein